MTDQDEPDHWGALEGRRELEPKETLDFAEAGPRNAAWIGATFFTALGSLERDVLAQLVTPESAEAWGDFSAAHAQLIDIDRPGMGSLANRALNARDVAYVKVLSHVTTSFVISEEQPVFVSAFISMVWRPEIGRWMVHSFGPQLAPERLPRTSPGAAPADYPR